MKDTNDDGTILKVENLRKSFGTLAVLKGVSMNVSKGEVISIVGASGSGKSTLLRSINLLEKPDSGSIHFKGIEYDCAAMKSARFPRAQMKDIRSSIGMVFQNFNLWPHKTVLENVIEAPIIVKKVALREAVERAEGLLDSIGLLTKKDEYPKKLSGGQQQRVAIVRALAMDPKIMLFDEVTSALDPELVGEVLDIMTKLAEGGMTMLVVTHEMGFARHVSDKTAFFHSGEIAEFGASEKVLGNPDNENTRNFLSRVLQHH